jgi:outer membrane lipoprotein-sorting protein
MTMRILLAGAAALALAAPAGAQDLPDLDSLMHHLDEMYRSVSSHAVMTMTVERERGTRSLTLESWSLGEDDALIVIREPAREAGTATLRTAEGLWNYAPRADRLIRIPTGLLSENWMGSHFTNDDLVRESSYDEDYETTLSWAEGEGGGPLIRATMTPLPDAPVVYTRIEYLMTSSDWVPTRADYYDQDKLIRSMVFDQVEMVAGKRIPLRMRIVPLDEPGEYTEIVYDVLELDVGVEADLFTRRGLRRVARG